MRRAAWDVLRGVGGAAAVALVLIAVATWVGWLVAVAQASHLWMLEVLL